MDFLLLRFATEGAFPPSPGPPATPFPSGFALKRGTAEGEGSAEQAGGVPADHGVGCPEPSQGKGKAKQEEREGAGHSLCRDSGALRVKGSRGCPVGRDRERPRSPRCSPHGAEKKPGKGLLEVKKTQKKSKKSCYFQELGCIRQGLASRCAGLMCPSALGTSRQLRRVWGRILGNGF